MKKTLLLTAVLAAGSVATVQALPSLSGNLEFGSFSPATLTGGSGTLSTATGISFFNVPLLGAAVVNGGATGDFLLLAGATAEFYDFTFNPLPGTGADVWFIPSAGVAFHLDSVVIDQQNAIGISLRGLGVVTAPGFEPTPGTFFFSMQGQDGDQSFSFSAGNTVPDAGSSMALLGLTILGLGAFSRRQA